ncbi:alpha/beta fold hydrolase [Microbacterium invictum]|uniref:Pimeloyl-ACP methyl ester carboxylesterase n=1 Tax=Microbacterium invictum TaxID=515415 RepID=A0AA40SMH3_9MICO|nr:alpha/beta fold hydrolase [Microbacterium invictum]MBB4138849.1 pimeloyl-ACP methyl ester carboxylesterase [Microbacterium invictum]
MIDRYRTVDVAVPGGALRVGVWDGPETDVAAPTVVLVHGVTASHLAWQLVADALPGMRVVAPDLRGRGRSNDLTGHAGMAQHADDLAAVFAALDIGPTVVVGHSMGAFASLVFAHRHPQLVSRLLLVDGGLPLAAPEGLSPAALVAAILGPTAARLDMRFAGEADYLDFWRAHPAFTADWSDELERYLAYDLVPAGTGYRPATSLQTVEEDTVDLNGGTALLGALAAIEQHSVEFVTVPRGLQNEAPGLYPPAHLETLLATYPSVSHERWDGFNHYTVVMGAEGAQRVAALIARQFTAVG